MRPGLSLFLVLGFQICLIGNEAWVALEKKRGSDVGLAELTGSEGNASQGILSSWQLIPLKFNGSRPL